jgi:hypothetical protein
MKMGKEFYSDAIKLLKSFARGNQSSRTIVGSSSKGRMQGKAPKSSSTTTGGGRPPVRGGRRKGGKV